MDGKNEVFCDGWCQQWMYCYCAGVLKTPFKLLSNSSDSKCE